MERKESMCVTFAVKHSKEPHILRYEIKLTLWKCFTIMKIKERVLAKWNDFFNFEDLLNQSGYCFLKTNAVPIMTFKCVLEDERQKTCIS